MMKILAVVALAFSINAYAAAGDQQVCANLADIGRNAATANSRGITEANALSAWSDAARASYDDKRADAVFQMGVIEIREVYRRGAVNEGDGYWIGYSSCMQAMR